MLRRTFGILAASLSLFGAVHCSAPAADEPAQAGAESDFTTTIDVKPIATFGSGNSGAGPNDIDEPDGIVFNKNGHLLMTDARNHRVHVWDFKTDKHSTF